MLAWRTAAFRYAYSGLFECFGEFTKEGRSANYWGRKGFARTSMVDRNGANEAIGRNRGIAGVVYQV